LITSYYVRLGYIISTVAPVAIADIEKKENAAGLPLDNRTSINTYATLLAYGALAGQGMKAYEPNFDYSLLFAEASKPTAKLADGSNGDDGLCLAELTTRFSQDILTFMKADTTRKVMDFPGIDQQQMNSNPVIQNFLQNVSQPGLKPISKPLLVIQGIADTNVPYVVTKGLVDKIKTDNPGNTHIELLAVPDAGHTQAIDWKRADLVKFIQTYMPTPE